MKRVFVQFLIILVILFGVFTFIKIKLRSPLNIAFDNAYITSFERLMVSGMGEEFSLIRIDSTYWLEVNSLSYPIESGKIYNYLAPLERMKSSKRIKKKNFDVLDSKGYWFDFSLSDNSFDDFGIYSSKGDYYYQSKVSKDYFRVDSFDVQSVTDFSYNNLLPRAIYWKEDWGTKMRLRSLTDNDTLAISNLDSLVLNLFSELSKRSATDQMILGECTLALELIDSTDQVQNRFNVALDSNEMTLILEQTKPFTSRVELDTTLSKSLLSLFGF